MFRFSFTKGRFSGTGSVETKEEGEKVREQLGPDAQFAIHESFARRPDCYERIADDPEAGDGTVDESRSARPKRLPPEPGSTP
ncbi:MAG TPA: hypothetical protein VHC22_33905 [Pirellulales bacterium]|nr:hypothetical protein [Pirellulales bacterium]